MDDTVQLSHAPGKSIPIKAQKGPIGRQFLHAHTPGTKGLLCVPRALHYATLLNALTPTTSQLQMGYNQQSGGTAR